MSTGTTRDLTRQIANVAAAVFQVGASIAAGGSVGDVSAENPTLVVPAGYAFAIWGPIFLLSLAYAAYQALPARQEDPLLLRVGWFSAGAFALDGLWVLLFPEERFLFAQVVLFATFACAAAAFLGFVDAERGRRPSAAERWLVGLPLGLLFGWITAATLVGVATTLVALDTLTGNTAQALLGTALLLLAGLIASTVVLIGKTGPREAYLAYAAAVLWALTAVVVEQVDDSAVTTAAAVAAAAAVVTALFRPGHRGTPSRRMAPSPTPPAS